MAVLGCGQSTAWRKFCVKTNIVLNVREKDHGSVKKQVRQAMFSKLTFAASVASVQSVDKATERKINRFQKILPSVLTKQDDNVVDQKAQRTAHSTGVFKCTAIPSKGKGCSSVDERR